ncbi:ornithine decarboxylase-like [Corticium candelabrum]|uniref:ornithine decarboxylase-like n=1 Tax=Corticium candelabrum TaxID=121492 RepID=UPI002E269C1D|nr:ornithine decarboxylase-like [Corticium candelabrum]
MERRTPLQVDVETVDASSSLAEIVSVLSSSPGRKDMDDPFYVVNLGTIIGQFFEWKRLLPRINPFYAFKCNDDPVMVRLLAALGLGFDCASKTEIKSVLDIGIEPERIVYANPCKQVSHLRYAAQQGVSLMTFDNEYELHKVKANYPSAKLVLRVKVDDSKSICQLNIKFGANPEDVPSLLKTAKELGLDVVGVSFHVGSGCCDANAFSQAVQIARNIFDDAIAAGFKPSILDVGGGFPGTSDAVVSFEEVAVELNRALNEHFPIGCGIEIIAEPGRFFAAASHTLVTNVGSKRLINWTADALCSDVGDGVITIQQSEFAEEEIESEKGFMYYLNEGVYSSFNCIVFDHVECRKPKTLKVKDGPLYPSSLWGPTCDSMDKIKEYCELPELDVGEWVYFEEMGAYTKSAASTFNGYSKAHSYYIITKELKSEMQLLSNKIVDTELTSVVEQPHVMQSLSLPAVALKSVSCQVA